MPFTGRGRIGGDCWHEYEGMLMNNSVDWDVFDDSGRAVLDHGCDVCDGGIACSCEIRTCYCISKFHLIIH